MAVTRKKTGKVTAADIRHGMSKRWAAPEYAVMWEVGEATGLMRGRSADAVIMSLWPSRGLELHGVEIKVSRSDWKREAADPAKAEAIAKFCDRWWVHTAPGVVDDLSDLPPAWGLREFDGSKWKTLREAELTEAAPVTRGFLAALLRRADGAMRDMIRDATAEGRAEVEREREALRERHHEAVAEAVERKLGHLSGVQKSVAEFEAAFGTRIDSFLDFSKIGRAARALADVGSGWGDFRDLSNRLRRVADEIDAITALSAVPTASDNEQERTA
ncbi:hypothetical protein BCL74_2105 [Oceanibaculum indicum]|uniref:MmcB family DNA repair protein n=2 Tax=Oceanibaculum indicum TaxID=526216 RepID=A0A420WGV1_9PROT|nr:hypothetical protein BCL74_2105 [Oceanibaculum indicum]